MDTANIVIKIDELADMIRVLRNEMTIIVETGDDDQYTAAVNIRRLLRNGLRSLEDLAVAVELAKELLEA